VNRDSSIIPKIILILGFLSAVGIILLFFRPQKVKVVQQIKPDTQEKLFAQVIHASQAQVLRLWEEGDRLLTKQPPQCPQEIALDAHIGRSYFQCQPHLWQCYWQGGIKKDPHLAVDLFGQTFRVRARAAFPAITQYSAKPRYYEIIRGPYERLNFHYGMLVELIVDEIPGLSWPIILSNSCRDTYLPQRIYPYGKLSAKEQGEGFIWDNFDRHIYIDKFYVTNQQLNEWYLLMGKSSLIITDNKLWPYPALIDRKEQKDYCAFWGKRLLEAKLFDAASMPPVDLGNPRPEKVSRPQTPWQRDLSKTFLGMSRINPDYQLTPLDCQLAQVKGCQEKHFTTDSVSWMGMNYTLGFYPESLINNIETEKNLKQSSRFNPPDSKVHELANRTYWNGKQTREMPVAFRCYEEVSL
jgi:hypothetical protein